MLFFTPMVLLPEVQQFTANTEMFMILPLMGMLATAIFSLHGARGARAWLFAGIFGAISVWYKYTAAPMVGTLFAVWCAREWLDLKSASRLPRKLAFAAAGAFAVSIPILLPFLISDGAKQLWECTIRFNRFYTAAQPFGISGLRYVLNLLWTDWWILFLLPLALVVKPFLTRRARIVRVGIEEKEVNLSHSSHAAPAWFWAALFTASWLGTAGSIYGHYYVALMPFWAVLAALGAHHCAGWLARAMAGNEIVVRWLLVLAVTSLLCLSDLPWIQRSRQQFAQDKLSGGNPFLEAVSAAERVASMTSINDFVFVAGSEPEIYCYSARLNPSRFITMYPLMIPTVLAAGYQQELINTLQREPPKVIVLARSGASWLRDARTPGDFLEFLNQLLKLKYDRGAGFIPEGTSGHWAEQMENAEASTASLVLYKLKPK
jgi:hypothetical protein